MRTPKTVFIKPKEKTIDFYLKDDRGNVYYLFTQKYTVRVHEYFGNGLSWSNLKTGLKKKSGKYIEKILEKIPKYAKYVLQYEAH